MRQTFRLFLSLISIAAAATVMPLMLTLPKGSLAAANAATPFEQGQALLQSRRYRDALVVLNRAIQADPRFAPAYSSRCAVHLALGDGRSAAADCEEALLLNPNLADAYVNRGNLRIAAGDIEGAFLDAEQALIADPTLPGGFDLFGQVYLQRSEFTAARADLNRALSLDPNFIQAYVHRANAELSLNNATAAAQDYTQAVRRDPSIPVPADLRELVASRILLIGENSLDRGELQAALADFNLALRVNPNSAGAHSGRGLVFEAQGQPQAALAAYEQALALDPGNLVALEGVDTLRPPTPTPAPVVAPSDQELEARFIAQMESGLTQLEGEGVIPLGLPADRLISMGRQTCFLLNGGQANRDTILTQVVSRHLGSEFSLDDLGTARTVNLVLDTGVDELCPQFVGML